MKIAYLTAGAAGMNCGSCMLDNALARALIELGHDCLLVPLYTPIRTDEEDVSIDQVFFGGINVYLQQKLPILRWLPRWLDASLNNAKLVKRLTANTGKTSPKLLGQLTISMLAGSSGNQKKEALRLCDWLASEIKPECVILSNFMIAGVVPEIRRRMKSKVWVVLQGDDIFLDSLPEPYQSKSIELMRSLVPQIDGFVIHSHEYAKRMGDKFGIPPEKRFVLPLGIDTRLFTAATTTIASTTDITSPPALRNKTHDGFTIGYLARLSPEKGLQRLVKAFTKLAIAPEFEHLRLHIAGYLGPQHAEFWEKQQRTIADAGLADRCRYFGAVDRAEKANFLKNIDLLCVPTVYQEPKGLFVLESVAAGTPYLLPNHGAFTEMHSRLNFGWLFEAMDDADLFEKLRTCSQAFRPSESQVVQLVEQHVKLLDEIDIRLMAHRKALILTEDKRNVTRPDG